MARELTKVHVVESVSVGVVSAASECAPMSTMLPLVTLFVKAQVLPVLEQVCTGTGSWLCACAIPAKNRSSKENLIAIRRTEALRSRRWLW